VSRPPAVRNDVREILTLVREGRIKRGDFALIHVLHDWWCPMLSGGGRCTCRPELVIEPLEPGGDAA